MGKNKVINKGLGAAAHKSKKNNSVGGNVGRKSVDKSRKMEYPSSLAVMLEIEDGKKEKINKNAELIASLEEDIETDSVSSSCSLGDKDTSEDTQMQGSEMQSVSLVPESDNVETEAKLTKAKPTFASLFAGNRQPSESSKLERFTRVDGPIVIEESEVQDSGKQWEFCLVGYFGGRFPGKQALKQIVDSWKVPNTIHYHNSGWIIFQFEKVEHQVKVLENGPYLAFGRPLLLKIMPQYFRFQNEEISCFPVWIQLRNLPLELWSSVILSKICSQLGKPIYMDKLTAQKDRINFARCLVEIDMAKDLIYMVEMQLPNGETLEQPIFYENLPRFCSHCKAVGHSLAGCKVREKQKLTANGKSQELQQVTKAGSSTEDQVQKISAVATGPSSAEIPESVAAIRQGAGSSKENAAVVHQGTGELEAGKAVQAETNCGQNVLKQDSKKGSAEGHHNVQCSERNLPGVKHRNNEGEQQSKNMQGTKNQLPPPDGKKKKVKKQNLHPGEASSMPAVCANMGGNPPNQI